MAGENPGTMRGVIVKPAHAGINQTDHVLSSGRVRLPSILLGIQFFHQSLGIGGWQPAVPKAEGNLARTGGHSGPVHVMERGLEADEDHRSRRRGIEARHKWLVDPSSGQLQPIGEVANRVGDSGHGEAGRRVGPADSQAGRRDMYLFRSCRGRSGGPLSDPCTVARSNGRSA